ncbi:MAG: hypothetical protein J0L53_07610 [Spirochaetes bacterium]|nr:hypothetical protein [Spirochaetota bacterium]MBX3721912.1 hypothetical protein [Turneriella sp.]
MNFFRKFTSAVTGYLVLYAGVAAEIGRYAADFFKNRWARFHSIPLVERVFAFLTGVVIIFTFLPWRSYRIQFGDSDPRKHGIYSDDFALILVGCLLAAISLVAFLLPQEPKLFRRGPIYRYAGIAIVALFAVWNWINPYRIAPTKEATFAWSFYAFELVTLLWVVTGMAGGRFYATPQNPART